MDPSTLAVHDAVYGAAMHSVGIALSNSPPRNPADLVASGVHRSTPSRIDPVKLRENLTAAIEHLNKQLAGTGRTLGFAFDDVLNSPVVTVKNTATGEVIRQIPSEAVVKAAHTMDELKGLLHDATS